jgi:hypothetical protein
VNYAADHLVGFELAQLLGQHLLRDLRNGAFEIRETQNLAAKKMKEDHQLPAAIAGYIASANSPDAAACARYFTEDATVHDEGADRHGIAAIREWKEEVSRKYRPIISATGMTKAKEKIIVTARVAGHFQGSPIDLHFTFTLRGDRISRLDITP